MVASALQDASSLQDAKPEKQTTMRLARRRPPSRVRTLEIFKREAALIGAQGGELPAVGADPEARGLGRLREGDLLCVPTGRSVLDVLQLSGICADGHLVTRDEERRQNLRDGLRWHQGENDPNPRGWKTIDRLAQVDPSWFCRLMPDETRPIRFAVIDSDTGSVETFTTLTLKRVAGQAQRITFREADRDEITLDDWLAANVGGDGNPEVWAAVRAAAGGDLRRLQAMRPRDLSRELPLSRWDPATRDAFLEAARDLRAGELGIERSARYEAEAFDSLANTAHRCACAARLTVNAMDAAAAAFNLCQLEVRRWVKGSDPADAEVDLLSLGAHDVAVVLEETDATFIEVRLVDATHNARPIEDLRVSLAMRLSGNDDDDDLLNVARTVELELRLENERGRAAREAAQRVALPPPPAMPAAPPMPPAPAPRRKAKTGGERRGKKRPRTENNGTFAETVLASVTCPISQSLVVRPVIAEDGKTYEREHIERWLRQKKSSPLTNQRMGTHLNEHCEGRSIVASAIENGLVDADAAASWHLASARHKIVGELPGGLASAKEHLAECERAEGTSSDRDMLLEAFTLREQVKSFVARAGERGLGSEVVRLLTVDRPSGVVAAAAAPMTAWRYLVPHQSVIRIIRDVDEFQRLCERPAPGAAGEVGWEEGEMEELAGEEFTVEGLDEDDRAYKIKVGRRRAHYRVPFDACILVRM